MRYWILKGKRRSEFGFDNDFAVIVRRGQTATWVSSKLLHVIQPGDRLFVYEGSPKFEVWGLARYLRRSAAKDFSIRYETDALDERVQRDRDGLRSEALFAGAVFLKPGAVQTIYEISEEQATWLYRAVLRHTPHVAGTWPELEASRADHRAVRPVLASPPVKAARPPRAPQPRRPTHPSAPPAVPTTQATITRAISIRQPYVELILRGEKRFEYRSRPTNIRERVWLYAGLTPGNDAASWRDVDCEPGDLPTGVIVGSVEIADCRATRDGFAYALARPERLAAHLRAINQPQPGFWRPQFR